MSEHFGDRSLFPPWKPRAAEARERLEVIKKAPESVLNRLNEIAAEINELEVSKAQDEETLRGAHDAMERAQRIITSVEQRARLRELQLATLENELKTVLLVVTAYETTPHAPTQERAYKGNDGRIVAILSQSNEPLTRHQIADQLPGSTLSSVSTMLSQLKAEGLIQKVGNRRWQIR